MTKVSNLFLMIVAVTLALYTGTKGYLYYKAHDLFKKMSVQVAPLGELSYGGIATTLSGKLIYEDLAFTVRGSGDAITVNAVAFKSPNLIYLIGALSGASSNQTEPPEQLQLNVEGASVDLNSPLLVKLDSLLTEMVNGASVEQMMCDWAVAGPAQYRALGYKKLSADFQLGYRHYARDSSLTLEVKVNVTDVSKGEISIYLKEFHFPDADRATPLKMPTLSKVELLHEDVGYAARVNHYCANFKGMSVDDYIVAASNQTDDYYLNYWGFAPGNGLRWAYRSYLTNPGKVRIVVRPPESFDLPNFTRYSPRDLPALLDMSVEVNGQPVDDLTITAIAKPEERSPLAAQPPSQASLDSWRAAGEVQRKNLESSADRYQRVALNSLNNHVGQKVRIVLDQGAIREGWLAATTDGNLKIEQHLNNSTVSMLVAVKQINYVEVLAGR